MRFLLFFFWITNVLCVTAQDFQFIKYSVKDGLPTDVVKAVMEDSLGFIWIATDDGLTKFDGTRFTQYKGALHSQYAKAFLKSRAGNIFLIGDLDLIQIDSRVDTAAFSSVRQGTRNPTDSSLWYPKSMYEDHTGNLWISEPQSVSRINGKLLQRIRFGLEDQTPEFLRSFSFFEDQKNTLFCVSYFGRIFQYDTDKKSFTKLKQVFPTDIKAIKIVDGTIWVVAFDGLYASDLLVGGGFSIPKKRFDIENGSCIQPINRNRLFVGTSNRKQYIIDLGNDTSTLLPFEINDVNDAFASNNHDLWLSSSEGLILLQENLFSSIQARAQATFIESIAEDSAKQTIYYASILNLFSAKIIKGIPTQPKVVLNIPRGYFQAMKLSKEGLWVSNRYSVLLLRDDKIYKTWDFEKEGRFVFDLFVDSRENLWVSQDGNRKAICIDKDLVTKRYSIPLETKSNIIVIREDETGLLAASVGQESYLFHKQHEDSVFRNISVPVKFQAQGDFSIVDLAVDDGVVWLASTEGLLRYDYKTLGRVDLGDINTELSVKTIKSLNKGELLFSNALGMIRYQIATGDWWMYNVGNGLSSNTISTRGILVGSHNRVWVGTSVGLCYTNSSIILNQKSTTPLFTQAIVNGNVQSMKEELHIPYGGFLNLILSTNTYPQSKVNLQYRFKGNEWRSIKDNQLSISEQPPGNYEIEIRAKKNGGYDWSDVQKFFFVVDKPFWQRYWFMALLIASLTFVGVVSYQIANGISKRRRTELENILVEIKERNEEIQAQSEELKESNQSLNKLYVALAEQKEELQMQAEELTEANHIQSNLYQALAEKSEEIQAQSEELTESNETIRELNINLALKVEEKNKDLIRTNEELSKYNSDLLQFSYSVSHNLRGPVARLLGLSNLIVNAEETTEIRKMASMVQSSSLELDTVLRDLTNIIDMRNNLSHIREKVYFAEEWRLSFSMLQDQVKKEYKIDVNFSEAPYIFTVRALLQSIMYNLISNAIKYHSPDRELRLAVRSWSLDTTTFLEVKDNGLGFDLNTQRDKIFKLYKRFHTHIAGKGLGLYLVKTQTELLSGKISIESEINKGTTFCLALPTPEAVERQVFLDNETALLYYDANINNTVIIWKKEITSDSYRLVFETVLNTLKTYNSPGWIADLRDQGIVPEVDQLWFSANILSEAVKNGLKRIATVGFSDTKRVAYYKLMVAKAAELGIELKIFENLEEAIDWMRHSLGNLRNQKL